MTIDEALDLLDHERVDDCPECDGQGDVEGEVVGDHWQAVPCWLCRGTGRVRAADPTTGEQDYPGDPGDLEAP